MEIEVLRIGQRVVRDDRVTTHVALVARAFGASKIFMSEVNPEIRGTLEKIRASWGGDFEVEHVEKWKKVLMERKNHCKIVHLTMYGQNINDVQAQIGGEKRILVVVGAEKVPREVYEMADYNVGIGNQPHSEVSALAVLLDRIQGGRQFNAGFAGAQKRIVPSRRGKNVITQNND